MIYFRVALLIDPTTAAGRQLYAGATAAARTDGRWVIWSAGLLADLDPSGVDGAIVGPPAERAVATLSAAGVPCVNTSVNERSDEPAAGPPAAGERAAGERTTVVRVRPDAAAAGRLAAEALLGTGARSFAHTLTWSAGRANGSSYAAHVVRTCLARLTGPGQDAPAGPPDDTSPAGFAAWLTALPKPCGVLAATPADAFHLLEAAALTGVRVPDELHVLSAEPDDMFVSLARVAVAHVDPGYAEVGRQAAAALGRLMTARNGRGSGDGGSGSLAELDELVPPAGLVAGGSLRPAANADPLVRRALALMADQLADPLPIPALAAALGVSRRTLELRFEAVRRASPASELRRLRVERACRLLAETNQPVRDVATACGFAAVELLQRAMQKQVGMAPSEYRARRRADR